MCIRSPRFCFQNFISYMLFKEYKEFTQQKMLNYSLNLTLRFKHILIARLSNPLDTVYVCLVYQLSILHLHLPVQMIVTGFVSCVTASDSALLNPDILHLYAVKSVGHRTLFLSMVSFSVAELGVLISDPAVEARFRSADADTDH